MNRSSDRTADLWESGNRALDVLEVQLQKTPFLAGNTFSIADMCLYGYTHGAELADFDSTSRTGIARWLKCVTAQPGHVAIDWLP
jgi:glutathione S-transferase